VLVLNDKYYRAKPKMTYWEIIADSLEKAGWSLGQGLSPWIPRGERVVSE